MRAVGGEQELQLRVAEVAIQHVAHGEVAVRVQALGGPELEPLDSYEDAATAGDTLPIPTSHDEAIIERLKALGYLDDE